MNSLFVTSDYFEQLLDRICEQRNYTLETGLSGLSGRLRACCCNFAEMDADPGVDYTEAGFINSQAFYEAIYAKLGTSQLTNDYCIIVDFPEAVPSKLKTMLRAFHVTYLVFNTVQGIEVLFTPELTFNLVGMFAKATSLKLLENQREMRHQQVEAAFYLLLQKAGMVFAETLPVPELAKQNQMEASDAELLLELLVLVTRDEFQDDYVQEAAKELELAYSDPETFMTEMEFDEDEAEYLIEDGLEKLCGEHLRGILNELELIHSSDWKFDAEEIVAGLRDLVEEELLLELDSAVYSHDLFPQIDCSLQKYELELLNFDTQGDSYDFLLVRRKDTPQIIRLCQHFGIPIERTFSAEA